MDSIRTPPDFLAIDIGSNAVKMKSWRLPAAGVPVQTDFQRHAIRLGAGVFADGNADPTAVERLAALLAETRRAVGLRCTIRAIATSALREAKNREAVVTRLREASGIDVRVLSGEEEARLMALGVLGRRANSGPLAETPHLLLDIGGGSSEIIRTRGAEVIEARSYPLGAVRLRRQCFADADPPSAEQTRRAEAWIEEHLKACGGIAPAAPGADMIGLAGTITTLAKMLRFDADVGVGETFDPLPEESGPISMKQIRELSNRMATMPAVAIAAAYPIEPDRAEVIFAGAVILIRLLHLLKVDQFRVAVTGIADGLLEESLIQG
jgi:exopolyphosphatase/guanosine-5'-triphosphate,3'-diphosphate pyrophosphatase